MGDKTWTPENVLDVLGDPISRRVLVLAAESPKSATRLARELDVTPPTVYRRLDELEAHGLVREHSQIDDDGNHYRTFETVLSRVEVGIDEGTFVVDVGTERNLGDRFETFWSEFKRGAPNDGVVTRESDDASSSRDDVSPS